MELAFQVFARIAKPVSDVFEAIIDPARLSAYFTTGGASARLEAGKTVMWDFHDFPGAFPVDVIAVEQDRRIILRWGANDAEAGNGEGSGTPYQTTVTIAFEPLDADTRTLVTIGEEGWRETEAGLKASYGNCMGWSQMLCALKIYLEHGIHLRQGMYK